MVLSRGCWCFVYVRDLYVWCLVCECLLYFDTFDWFMVYVVGYYVNLLLWLILLVLLGLWLMVACG